MGLGWGPGMCIELCIVYSLSLRELYYQTNVQLVTAICESLCWQAALLV